MYDYSEFWAQYDENYRAAALSRLRTAMFWASVEDKIQAQKVADKIVTEAREAFDRDINAVESEWRKFYTAPYLAGMLPEHSHPYR